MTQVNRKTPENLRVLFALMALGGKSDRAIAKALGISNTTVSRRRRILEQEGYIKEYAVIPDFHKLGLDVIVFTYASTTNSLTTAQTKGYAELMQKYPEIICALEDQGLTGTNWLGITLHKNYDSFVEFYKRIRTDASIYQQPRIEMRAAIFHTGRMSPKPFSLRKTGSLFSSDKRLQTIEPSFMSEKSTSKERTQENLRVLFALMALGGKSDRAIAKALGISTSTLSRRRRILEQEGYIKEYTVIPDFHKLGLDVIAFTFTQAANMSFTIQTKEDYELLQKYPEVLCILEDQGLTGTNWLGITLHKNFDGFVEFYKQVEKELLSLHDHQRKPHYETVTAMFRTGKMLPKPFSLRNIASLCQSTNLSQIVKSSPH